jgi:hypothetical protein
MGENYVMKPDTENSNSSRMLSTSDATCSSVKNVDPFSLVEVNCEVEVSTVRSFSIFNEATLPAELTWLQMNVDWILNDELRV